MKLKGANLKGARSARRASARGAIDPIARDQVENVRLAIGANAINGAKGVPTEIGLPSRAAKNGSRLPKKNS